MLGTTKEISSKWGDYVCVDYQTKTKAFHYSAKVLLDTLLMDVINEEVLFFLGTTGYRIRITEAKGLIQIFKNHHYPIENHHLDDDDERAMFDSIKKEVGNQNLHESNSLELLEETSYIGKEAEELQNSNLNKKSIGNRREGDETSNS